MFKTKEHQHFSADIPLSGWFSIPRIKTIPNIGGVLGALMNVILPAELSHESGCQGIGHFGALSPNLIYLSPRCPLYMAEIRVRAALKAYEG